MKIGDFGLSKLLIDDYTQTQCGTRAYMSPESLDGRPYTVKSDVYALGCLMHELCSFQCDQRLPSPSNEPPTSAQTAFRSLIRLERSQTSTVNSADLRSKPRRPHKEDDCLQRALSTCYIPSMAVNAALSPTIGLRPPSFALSNRLLSRPHRCGNEERASLAHALTRAL